MPNSLNINVALLLLSLLDKKIQTRMDNYFTQYLTGSIWQNHDVNQVNLVSHNPFFFDQRPLLAWRTPFVASLRHNTSFCSLQKPKPAG